ncbi:U8 snoRNA-decapping enzyme [Scomber scombrus]|uniref:U8 snoRNA-decapping enzyme n=1 Tax=Scomber scombrus TaxID=13677 RepID=A0AAV1N6N0_SCOSC|nr:U8 snoRNA-decapping enzyme [Scomber scombrus]XP_062283061.1 U8 snoRNA-decapping enzyme [Scomber scombrus]XP_062283062.1 U8 snoRNA-decapping enzyme [Scomber scombrus]
MASGQLSRAEALACAGCRHACHVMLYSDTKTQLFGKIPIKHIILMQMRFDGLLGFPGGLVNPAEETLEGGLGRELLEELGVAIPVSIEDHVDSCYAPESSRLITHFYVKKMEEEQIREVERAAASTATDHGQEVLGMVRVPLYVTKGGGGLSSFLSHSFIGNARSQLVDAVLRFNLVDPEELHKVLVCSLKTHAHTAEDLQAALALTEAKRKRF